MNKLNILVLFGGKSTEHDISIISALQVLNALDSEKYNVLPVYVTKDGNWFLGNKEFFKVETFKNEGKLVGFPESLLLHDPNSKAVIEKPATFSFLKTLVKHEIDVIFPVFHGGLGENGSFQGLFELTELPYVGCDVASSAISMDKVLSKKVAKSVKVPVLPDLWFEKGEWFSQRSLVLKRVLENLSFPVFVKPVHLGSTIGIQKAKNKEELENALDVVFHYDTKAMVEESLEDSKDINISIIGNYPDYELSVCEEPIRTSDVLSFEDKYIQKEGNKGMAGAKRIVPAKIKKETEIKIGKYALSFFSEIGGSGICRIDFLVSKDEKQIYFNEINPMPGSLAFYLWKAKGIAFPKLLDKLIGFAIEKHKTRQGITTTFSSSALTGFGGAKGKA